MIFVIFQFLHCSMEKKRKAPSMKTACKNSKEKWVKCATKIACLTLSEPGFWGAPKTKRRGGGTMCPPPNTINTANEGRFRLNVDPHMGSARNLRKFGAHARPFSAPGAAALGFHFQLEHARVEGKPRRRLPSPCRRKKALSTRSQLICWPLLPTFLGGLGTQPNEGRTSPWQMSAGQAGAANISWSA